MLATFTKNGNFEFTEGEKKIIKINKLTRIDKFRKIKIYGNRIKLIKSITKKGEKIPFITDDEKFSK